MNPLHSVIQFAFGCRHRHVSRVFTINKRTYKVCLDCGRELCYRMLTSRMHSSSLTSAPGQKRSVGLPLHEVNIIYIKASIIDKEVYLCCR